MYFEMALILCLIAYSLWNVCKCNHMKTETNVLKSKNKILDLENSRLEMEIVKLSSELILTKLVLSLNKESNQFTKNELKRIRFAIHPDKNGGKTNEIFIKVNKLLGE